MGLSGLTMISDFMTQEIFRYTFFNGFCFAHINNTTCATRSFFAHSRRRVDITFLPLLMKRHAFASGSQKIEDTRIPTSNCKNDRPPISWFFPFSFCLSFASGEGGRFRREILSLPTPPIRPIRESTIYKGVKLPEHAHIVPLPWKAKVLMSKFNP